MYRYMASNDPQFEEKAANIIGLYMKPPQHAAVFCVDGGDLPSRRWIVWTPYCLCHRAVRNDMGSSISGTGRCRCSPRWTLDRARFWQNRSSAYQRRVRRFPESNCRQREMG